MHDTLTDLTRIAMVASFAVILGFGFMRMRQPPIVGYIIAGLILGPSGLGVVENSETIRLLAELGVLALLFIIGMELSIRAFTMVLRPAVVIVVGQIAVALLFTFAFGQILDWPWDQVLLLAFIVAISSTAVAIKVLEEIGELRTETGRITVGIMIAQDIAIVPMLILTTTLGRGSNGEGIDLALFLKMAVAIGLLAGLLAYLSRPGKLKFPFSELVRDRKDVMALAMLAFCFAAATISGLVGLSAAYGAFVAGLIVSSSTLRGEAISVTQPIQSILVFVFFLSVGLLLDLSYVADNLLTVVSFTIGVVLAKTLFNVLLIRYSGFNWEVAFPAALATAQIGEFSFILAAVGLSNRVLDFDSYRLALTVIALSLIVSPIWMMTARRFHLKASAGISDFRAALSVAYGDELSGLGRGTRLATAVVRRPRVFYRAMRRGYAASASRAQADAARADAEQEAPADSTAQEATPAGAAAATHGDAPPKRSRSRKTKS